MAACIKLAAIGCCCCCCLIIFSGVCAVETAEMGFAQQEWALAMASVPEAMQWPTVLLQLGMELPSVLQKTPQANPACTVWRIAKTLVPNGSRAKPTWTVGERPKRMFEAARHYNQEVWLGTRHREILTVKERQGGMEVETTLSVVTCQRGGYQGFMEATVEAFGSGVNWFKADDTPCGTVRMPTWLFTKVPLDAEQRRSRQGVDSSVSDGTGSRAGTIFSSIWYGAFDNVKVLSNKDGLLKETQSSRAGDELNSDYERRALLDRRDGEVVEAAINRVGFDWQDSHYFIDYLRRMGAEACLDDHGTEECDELKKETRFSFVNWPFKYKPWEDRWTFNSEDTHNPCTEMALSANCSQTVGEDWSSSLPIIEKIRQGSRPDVSSNENPYAALFDSCPTTLVLSPGNMSTIEFGRGDRFGDQHYKMLVDNARELQLEVYNRIPKNDFGRTPTSTLILTLVIGIVMLVAAASADITLTAAKFTATFFSKRDPERKLQLAKYLLVAGSAAFVAVAAAPVTLLLIEELRKIDDVRVDGEVSVDTTRRTSIEGDGFLANFFVVSVQVKDTSSRWKECVIILASIVFLGFLTIVKRIWNLERVQKLQDEAVT